FEIFQPIANVFVHTHEWFKGRRWQVPDYGEACRTHALARLRWLDELLASRSYVAGDRYTIADITLLVGIDWAASRRRPPRPNARTCWPGTSACRPGRRRRPDGGGAARDRALHRRHAERTQGLHHARRGRAPVRGPSHPPAGQRAEGGVVRGA